MPNKKISQLNYNTHPTTADLLPIVNSGETKQISVGDLSYIISPSITITKSELDSLISSSGLTQSRFYKVTGVNVDLYGGTDIIIQAVSTHQISKNGNGLFYNPNYDSIDIWNPISILSFDTQNGFFNPSETIIGNSGQIGQMIGLPGENTISFILIQGNFSGGTSFTGVSSNATAVVTDNNIANYNIGDIVIWGGKVWQNISGTSTSVVNKVVYTGTSDYWQYFNIGGVELNHFSITNGVETLTYNGNKLQCNNLTGNMGGVGCVSEIGDVSIHFNAGPVNGVQFSASYTTNIVSFIDAWHLDNKWKLVPFNETQYTPTWDIIEYEYNHDNISYRKDAENELSSQYAVTVNYWGYNSIKAMQWGGKIHQFKGKNPYLYNLVNFNGDTIQRFTIDEGGSFDIYQPCNLGVQMFDINIREEGNLSFDTLGIHSLVSNINVGANSSIDNIVLGNNDNYNMYFLGINLGSSSNNYRTYINNIYLSSGSYFYGIDLDSTNNNDTTINSVYLNNSSGVFSIKLSQGSRITNISNNNNAIMRDIQLGQGAYIHNIDIYNGGNMFNIKLDGGNNSERNFIQNVYIGQDSSMYSIVLGLGSSIQSIIMNNSYCNFKNITLGQNSSISTITYNTNYGYFRDVKIGNNSTMYSIDLHANSNFRNNTLGDDCEVSSINLLNGAYFDYIEMSKSSYISEIILNQNSELGYLQLGLYAEVYNIVLAENIYIGEITIGEGLFLGSVNFSETIYGKIIDKNNNNFPATYYVDELNSINLNNIQYAGVVTLKTKNASLTYNNYAGTGFTINDVIHDITTNATAIITDNSVTYGVVIGEIIGTGDGSQPIFSFALSNPIEIPNSIVITDTVETFYDDGNGNLNGNYGGTGFINYGNGTGQVTFNNAPSYNQAITANYENATGGTLTLSVRSPKTYNFNHGDTITNGITGIATVDVYTPPSTATTITTIYNMYNNENGIDCGFYPVKFLPEYGLTVTFSGTPISNISNNQIAMPAQNFVANGSFDDYIVIGLKNNYSVNNKTYVQQIDAQNYN